jgi:hypothetical protein
MGGELFRPGQDIQPKEHPHRKSGPLDSRVVRRFGSSHTITYLVVNYKEILADHEELGIVKIQSRPLANKIRKTRRRKRASVGLCSHGYELHFSTVL